MKRSKRIRLLGFCWYVDKLTQLEARFTERRRRCTRWRSTTRNPRRSNLIIQQYCTTINTLRFTFRPLCCTLCARTAPHHTTTSRTRAKATPCTSQMQKSDGFWRQSPRAPARAFQITVVTLPVVLAARAGCSLFGNETEIMSYVDTTIVYSIVSRDQHPKRMKFLLIPSKNGQIDQGLVSVLQVCRSRTSTLQVLWADFKKQLRARCINSVQMAVLWAYSFVIASFVLHISVLRGSVIYTLVFCQGIHTL